MSEREAPRWMIVSAIVAAFAAVAYLGYVAILGQAGEPGPRKKVYPGMYDIRAEAAKMRAAQAAGAARDGR